MPILQKNVFVKHLSSFINGHPLCLTNLLLTGLTSGGEQLFEEYAFRCPTQEYLAKRLGWIYLFGPPVVFFSIALALNSKFWFFCHGCWKSEKTASETPTPVAKTKKKKPQNAPIADAKTQQTLSSLIPDAITPETYLDKLNSRKCTICYRIVFRLLLVPCVWIVTALFDGDFIACCCGKDGERELMREVSRHCAWWTLIVLVLLGASVRCCLQCRDNETYLQNFYEEEYWSKFVKETKKMTAKKAEKDVEALVLSLDTGTGHRRQEENDTQEASQVQPSSEVVELDGRSSSA